MKKISLRDVAFYGLILMILVGTLWTLQNMNATAAPSYAQVRRELEQQNVERLVVDKNNNLTLFLKDGTTLSYKLYSLELFREDFNDLIVKQWQAGILADYDYPPDPTPSPWMSFLPYLAIFVIFGFMWYFMFLRQNGAGGGGDKTARFGRARTRTLADQGDKKVTFDNVAGADEEKEELREIVEFLRDPKLYVGVGASRVRDLFDQAKKDSPAIVFIDEIDAVGRQRGAGLGGGHDEREQTLNQLLVEMDGFSANEGVIVLAATNRVDILDPALLRPGRFDRQVYVGYPDIKGREAILKIHARNKPLADDVSLAELAKATGGFTGADLENLMNEAALLAARREERFITMEDLREAVIKVIAGPEKKSKVVTPRERRLTAYHEAGHAVVNHSLETADPVHQITIVPRGGAGGMTISLPQEDKNFLSRTELTERIASLLGGRVAEQLTLGDISTGAGNDIQRASSIARNMVMRYGMSDRLGSVTFDTGHDEVFIGRSMAQAKSYSEEVAGIIDEEVKTLIDNAYARCESILKAHAKELDLVARYLLEHETMDAKTFEQVFTDPASLQAQLPADGDGDSASDPWPEPGNGDA